MDFDVQVDGLTHRVQGDHAPSEAEAEQIRTALRGQDAYTQAEQANGLPAGLLRAIASHESTFNPQAVSKTGARGLMQFTGKTGHAYGLTEDNFTDPAAQVAAAGRFMADNLKASGGDVRGALARYGDPKETDYPDKVLRAWSTVGGPAPGGGTAAPSPAEAPQAAGSPQGGTEPQSAPGGPQGPSSEQPGMLGTVASTAIYRLFLRPAANLNTVLYKHGMWAMNPQEFRDLYARHLPGQLGTLAQHLPINLPQGSLDEISRVAGGLEGMAPGLAAIGIGGQAILGDEEKADLLEGIAGFASLARQTPALVQKGMAGFKDLRSWFNARLLARQGAASAELETIPVAAAARAEQATTLANAAPIALSPEEQLTALAQGTTPEEAGRVLTARGRHVTELVPGEEVGVHGISRQLHRETDLRFQQATKSGAEVPIETTQDELLDFKGRLQTFFDRHIPPSAAATSRGVGEFVGGKFIKFADMPENLRYALGAPKADVVEPAQTISRALGVSAEEKQLLGQMRDLGGRLRQGTEVGAEEPGANHTLKDAMELYSTARSTINRREAFGGVPAVKKDFEAVTNTLGDAIRTMATEHPQVLANWNEATRYVLEEQAPFRAQVARKFGKASATPIGAFRSLIVNKDPTYLEQVMLRSGPLSRLKYQQGALSLLGTASGTRNGMDAEAFFKTWRNLPGRSRQLIAASATPEASRALAEWRPGAKLDEGALNTGVQAIDDLLATARKIQGDRQAVAKIAEQAKQGGAAGAARGRPVTPFAFYHLARAALAGAALVAVGTASGQQSRATTMATQLAIFGMLMRPDLAKQMLIADPASVHGQHVAAAMETMLRAYVEKKIHRPDQSDRLQQLGLVPFQGVGTP